MSAGMGETKFGLAILTIGTRFARLYSNISAHDFAPDNRLREYRYDVNGDKPRRFGQAY